MNGWTTMPNTCLLLSYVVCHCYSFHFSDMLCLDMAIKLIHCQKHSFCFFFFEIRFSNLTSNQPSCRSTRSISNVISSFS